MAVESSAEVKEEGSSGGPKAAGVEGRGKFRGGPGEGRKR